MKTLEWDVKTMKTEEKEAGKGLYIDRVERGRSRWSGGQGLVEKE